MDLDIIKEIRYVPQKGKKYFTINADGSVNFEIIRSTIDHHVIRTSNHLNCFRDRESANRIAGIQFLIKCVVFIADREGLDWKHVLWRMLNGWNVEGFPEEITDKLKKL